MKIADLFSIPLFAHVSPELLQRILPNLSHRTFLPGQHLFRSGDCATELLLILHGQVCIEREGSFLIARGEHEMVGEQALLTDGGIRTASATAQDLVSALMIPRQEFALLLEDWHFSFNLARELSNKLTQATKDRGYRYAKEALVFGEFRAHVATEVLDRLIQDGVNYGAPRKAEVIVLFSDIRDFTQQSAGITPEHLAQHLTLYLNHVVDIVHQHGGMVDKFVGDAVMAVWGAFEDHHPSLTQKAFDCAKCLITSAGSFNLGQRPIQIGVGLNAGTAFVGNIGGNGKRQFTVLGSVVNLASRFEAETKRLGPIVLGEEVALMLTPEVRSTLRKHVDVEIKGASPQRLYSFDPLKDQ